MKKKIEEKKLKKKIEKKNLSVCLSICVTDSDRQKDQ